MNIPLKTISASSLANVSLAQRQTIRDYCDIALALDDVAVLLWTAQGKRDDNGKRMTPSAGGHYPLHIYVLARQIDSLNPGLYRYDNNSHTLHSVSHEESIQTTDSLPIGDQPWLDSASAVLIIAADIDAMNKHFADQAPAGQRGTRYSYIETGAAAQNVQLQASTLGIGTVLVGGFDDSRVKQHFQLPQQLEPTALICLGAVSTSD